MFVGENDPFLLLPQRLRFFLDLPSHFDESLGLKKAHTQYRRAIFYMVSLASSRRNRRYFQDFIGAIMVTACHTGKS